MKQKWNQNAYGIDLDYLRRCKESTPEQRLDWLAAAREFAMTPKKKIPPLLPQPGPACRQAGRGRGRG